MLRNNKKKIISIILLKIFSLLILFLYLNKSSSRKYITNDRIKLKSNKYIVFECIEGQCRGWADRLKGILSAYAWSLITDRRFYININKPCQLSNMLEPNKINWITNFTQLYANFSSNNIKYIIGYDNYKLRKSIQNLTLDEFEQDSFDLIIIRNNLSWLKEMSKNKNIREKLIYLGYNPDKFNVQFLIHKWYNDLFKLNANLQVKYNNFLSKIKSNEILMCAQVRIGGGGKYDITFTERNNSIIYWNYIRNVFLNNNNNNSQNYKLFVTTDTQSIELEAKKEFGNNVIINEGLNTHLDWIQRGKVSSDCSEVSKTFLDFHSLQNCDKAIISQSGFGKLGVW